MFTNYGRDAETGLDYAQAGYYASKQGRFTSTAPLLSSAVLTQPQSWNRYVYCLNNPAGYADATGLIRGYKGGSIEWYKNREEMQKAQATECM